MERDSEDARWIAIVQLDGTRAVLRSESFSVRERDGQTYLVYPDDTQEPIAEFVGYLRTDADVVPYLRG